MGIAVMSFTAILLFVGETLAASSVPYKPITKCGAYEVYSECGNNACQNTCANPNIAPVCKATCICGCICVEGYLRNSKGVCVKPEQCDTCKANEIFSEYGNHPCQNTCAVPDLLPRCSYVAGRYPGCICKPGYLRNDSGCCVPENDCIPSCGGDPNAVFAPCGDPCPVTCNNKNNPILCAQVCLKEGGCRCKDGLVRNIHSKCILPEECPKCGENEFFDCGSACDTTCATLGQTCPIVNIKCNEMCYCVPGYARNDKNVCIPIKQCPPKKCPTNQVYNVCPIYCPPEQTCDDYMNGIMYDCVLAPEDFKCVPRCECKTGYIRRETNGHCIKPGQCCQDPNAEMVECPNTCPGGTCESPAFSLCGAACWVRGCQCKKGYVKDISGKCILICECRLNEIPVFCKDQCPLTCSFVTNGIHPPQCVHALSCILGYDCAPGYVRNDTNVCVKADTCRCPDPNAEVVSCPNPCPGGTCDFPAFEPCKQACKKYGCQCSTGYVKDAAGKCILLEKCPEKCKANETWNTCEEFCSFDKTCATIIDGISIVCTPPPEDFQCSGRCECLEGYVRNIEYECVPESTCCEDPNSEITNCSLPCHKTCFSKPYPTCEATECFEKGCKCKEGFVKNDSDKCIRREDCPRTCQKNEKWNPCVEYCSFDKTCSMIIDGVLPSCTPPPDDNQCSGECECLKGYVRTNNECVPEETCCEDPNSEMTKCPMPCHETCFAKPDPICEATKCFDKGCKCKYGFVKDESDKCIRRQDCPTCGPNEVYTKTCADCPETCANYGSKSPRCKTVKPGCACILGYVRECNKGKCIKLCDCKK